MATLKQAREWIETNVDSDKLPDGVDGALIWMFSWMRAEETRDYSIREMAELLRDGCKGITIEDVADELAVWALRDMIICFNDWFE